MTGTAALLARLGRYPQAARTATQKATVQAAQAAASLAAALAPVDTGTLQGSIAAAPEGNGAVVFAECDYAVYVELGARAMPPRPFLAPGAAEAGYPALATQAFREALK